MKCAACQYDDNAYVLITEFVPFIELEPLAKVMPRIPEYGIDTSGTISHNEVHGRPRTGNGLPYGTVKAFACPQCGTLRIEVPGGG